MGIAAASVLLNDLNNLFGANKPGIGPIGMVGQIKILARVNDQ